MNSRRATLILAGYAAFVVAMVGGALWVLSLIVRALMKYLAT